MCKEINDSKAVYIVLIQDFYKLNKRVPGRRDFESMSRRIAREFGSWNSAIKSAGLPVVRERNYTKANLKKSLLDFYITHGRAPKTIECVRSNGLCDSKIYMKVFNVDDWGAVLETVGLDKFLRKSKHSRNKDKALEDLVAFIRKEKITSGQYYERIRKSKGFPSMAYINGNLGGWRNLLKAAGFKADLSRELIEKVIKGYFKKNGQSPPARVLAKKLKTTVWCIFGITGSYNKLLLELGVPLNGSISEKNKLSKEELKQLYIDYSLKNGFENGASIKAINSSGELPNANIFIGKFGSMSDLRRICGFTPVNEFNTYSKQEIIRLLKREYILFRRPLKTEEINRDKNLPGVKTILRYLQMRSLKEVWDLIKFEIQNS